MSDYGWGCCFRAKQTEESTTIWFADPHIKGGANNPMTSLLYDGDNPAASSFKHAPDEMARTIPSFSIIKVGKIACSQKRHEVMFSRRSYEETEFFQKTLDVHLPSLRNCNLESVYYFTYGTDS